MAARSSTEWEPDDDDFREAQGVVEGEGPGEHDQHLLDDEESAEDTVACSSCGRVIWAHAQRCHHCGVHFANEAWQEQVAGEPSRMKMWMIVAALAVLAAGALIIFRFGAWYDVAK